MPKKDNQYMICLGCTHTENIHIHGEDGKCQAYQCECDKFS